MFIYQLNRIKYSQQYRTPYVGLVYTKLSAGTVSMLGPYRQRYSSIETIPVPMISHVIAIHVLFC